MEHNEKFNALMEELYEDKTAFSLYFSSLISSEFVSVDACTEKLRQLDMMKEFFNNKQDDGGFLERIENAKSIVSADLERIKNN